MSRNKRLAAASILTLAMGATACSGQGAEQQADAAQCGSGEAVVVNLPFPTQPTTLDPNYDTITDFAQISRNMFDGLFRLSDDMKVEPNLATAYTQPDDLTYNITLRDNVKFHDGSVFSAADVVSTFTRITSDTTLASKQKNYVANVASVTEVDKHQVKFTLKQPDASFIKTLATLIYITPASTITKEGNAQFGKNPIGTGAFKLKSWSEGDNVVLTANCDYFGGKTIPSQVEFRFIAEPATAISSLQSGELDITTRVAPDLAASLKSNSDVAVQAIDGNLTYWLTPNTLEGPFADPRVRQALNYAVDKKAIAEQLLGGYATPRGQVYSQAVFGSSAGVEPYPYDPEKAIKLLADAGYGKGEVPLELVNFREELRPVWQAIAATLGDAGFKVTTKFDPNFFADTYLARKMRADQVIILNNNNLMMDADFALGLNLDGARRGLYFHTPETDAEIAKARGIADPDARQKAYDELNGKLREIAPVGFLYNTKDIYGTSSHIDWKPRPDGAIYLNGVTKKP